MPFTIRFAPLALDHLKRFRKRDQHILLDVMADQLGDQKEEPPRNRKMLQANFLACLELRIGNFRVFYDVEWNEEVVVILAVGQIALNTLIIGAEKVDL